MEHQYAESPHYTYKGFSIYPPDRYCCCWYIRKLGKETKTLTGAKRVITKHIKNQTPLTKEEFDQVVDSYGPCGYAHDIHVTVLRDVLYDMVISKIPRKDL